MKLLSKLYDRLEEAVCLSLLLLITFLMALQVFCRYVLQSPLVWSEELARYAFIWMAFIGSAYTARKRGHVSIELFVNLLPKTLRTVVELIVGILIIATIVKILPEAIHLTKFMGRTGSSAMNMPMSYVYAAVPIGLTLTGIRVLGWIAGLTGALFKPRRNDELS
jgi:TRAP-type C4-dicarboxylate transport system permease small subunit